MTKAVVPTTDQILASITASLGTVPVAAQLAGEVAPKFLLRHVQDSGFAMPKDGSGALTEETRTLIYLAVALATGSRACVEAMTNKANGLQIDPAKLLETFKIARFAEATRILGNAEPLLASLKSQA
ncbi:MAG: carboxymuconolactone decarboxylase family protein [Brooklawnia sp.]|uniref:carboxymuconolactone decarboxylase family protein n=1 Tax=Brooklawnia sp. TaxID=2699740 RepID=UPI003C76AC8D